MSNARALAVGVAVGVAASCGGDGPRAGGAGDEAAPLELSLSHTIGAEAGPAAFGRVVDLALGDGGAVLVLDRMNRAVQVFDRSGVHVRTLGRRGGGPGELEAPTALFLGPDGGTWVMDPRSLRFTVYDTAGGLAATYPRPEPGYIDPWPGGFSAAGTLYDAAFRASLENPRPTLFEMSLSKGEPTILGRAEVPSLGWPGGFRYEAAGAVLMLAVPFVSFPVFQVSPDGHLWHGRSDHPWLYRHRLHHDGSLISATPTDSVRVIPADMVAEPVTGAERDSILEMDDLRELRAMGGAGAVARFMDLVPSTKPGYEDFLFDDGGRLWVARRAPEGGTRLDVYDGDGRIMAAGVAAIDASPRPRVRDGYLAGVARDPLGVESVRVYRVVMP
jgi:hypothetical protein